MATDAYMGKDGFVSLLGDTEAGTFIDTWSLSMGIGTAEVTSYGDNSKAFVSTIREWSVSLTGTMDRSDTHQDPLFDNFDSTTQTSVSIRLFAGSSTERWVGTTLPTGLTINSAVGDKVGWTAELQGSSNLSYWTSATA